MARRRCLGLAGVVMGAAALGCSGATARIQMQVEVEEGQLETSLDRPPWLTVMFEGHDEVTIDPDTVSWTREPPFSTNLQFQVSGVGPMGVSVDVLAFVMEHDPDPVLDWHMDGVKPGPEVIVVALGKPMTIKGDAGMPDADAGPDGGAPEVHPGDGGDAQQDGDAAGADGASDGADGATDSCHDDGGQEAGGPEVGVPGQTCNKYCDLMVQNCGMDLSTCQKTCIGLAWEPITDTNPAGNNLTCRILNAMLAAAPPVKQMDCEAATWNGAVTAGCGTPCDVYCDAGKVICSGAATFTNSACAAACRASFTPANRDCRVQALIDGDCSTATSGTGCP